MLQSIMHILNSQRVVLASGSPRRKQILQNVGLKFEVIPSTFEEKLEKSTFPSPVEYVLETARQKTIEVEQRLRQDSAPPDLIIGADTVVSMDGKIFEKPRDEQDAFDMLSGLWGWCQCERSAVSRGNRSHHGSSDSQNNPVIHCHRGAYGQGWWLWYSSDWRNTGRKSQRRLLQRDGVSSVSFCKRTAEDLFPNIMK